VLFQLTAKIFVKKNLFRQKIFGFTLDFDLCLSLQMLALSTRKENISEEKFVLRKAWLLKASLLMIQK